MPKKSLAPPTANIQPKDPAALLTVWMMVTTHPWWLDSDTTITVPYAAIDKVLDLDAGTTESIWNLARKNKAFMKKTGALFERASSESSLSIPLGPAHYVTLWGLTSRFTTPE